MAKLDGFEGHPAFAVVTVDRSVTLDTQAMEDVEDLGRHKTIAPDVAEHVSERIDAGNVCPSGLSNDPRHPLCKLPSLDQRRIRIVYEVSFGMRSKNCQWPDQCERKT